MDFGIDFGTTNSACTGIMDMGHVKKYSDREESPFPSIVIIDRVTGEVTCGREAREQREQLRESCEIISSVKADLGTDKVYMIAGKRWTPEMVTAQIFLGLKKLVGERGDDLAEAVVAVPVNFLPDKRTALRKAAEIAGVRIKTFVSEPTAALFDQYSIAGNYSKVAVFDWGGGTLDVSVVENSGGMIKELATAGLSFAGDHIDRKLAEWVHDQLLKDKRLNKPFSSMSSEDRDKMIARCERAKKDLCDDDIIDIRLLDYGGLDTVKVNIDIDTFTQLIAPEVNRAIACLNEALDRSRVSLAETGCILMVGGSVNLRPLQVIARQHWCDKVIFPTDSAWTVSNGAAQLSAEPGQHISSQKFGVTMSDGKLYPLVDEGTWLDNLKKEACFALVENSETANIVISDGNGNYIDSIDIPATGFLSEKICLDVTVSEDLVLNIVAKSSHRGKSYAREWRYPGITMNYRLPELVQKAQG